MTALLLMACLGAGGDTGDPMDTTYEEFVQRMYSAQCEWMLTCEPELVAEYYPYTTVEECAVWTEETAQGWPSECYGYDVEAALDCLEPWQEAPPSDGECGDTWGHSLLDEAACGAVCSNL